MFDARGLPQRRACRHTGLSLLTYCYETQHPTADADTGAQKFWLIRQLLRREGLQLVTNAYTAFII